MSEAYSNIKVLVVDDSVVMLQIAKLLLGEIGIKKIETSTTADAALKMIYEAKDAGDPYGLIICDLHMDEMNGFDLLQSIRSHQDFKKLPFIIITSDINADNVAKAEADGVDQYLIKPFDAEILESKIGKIFSK